MNINLQNKGITTLDFSSHDSVTASPKEVIALQLIESVDASHNRIVSIRHLSVFTALSSLNLAHNRLMSPVVDWFKALPVGLTSLNLSHNEISTIASNVGKPMSIGRLVATYTPRLLRLDLSYNLLHVSGSGSSAGADSANLDAQSPGVCDAALRELYVDHNTGLFSLNALAADLPSLVILSAGGNHIESLEALADLASSSPLLETIRLFDCAVARRLQDAQFLWNVMGGDAFNVQSDAERRAAQRDTAKLAPHFFASWVRQVLPSVKTVDGVSVAEADALVGPLLRGPAASRELADDEGRQHMGEGSTERDGDESSSGRSSSHSSTTSKSGSSESTGGVRTRGYHSAQYRSVLHESKPLPPPWPDDPSEAPPHVLQRIDYLHRRVVELQAFIAESKRSLRLVSAEKTAAAAELSRARQTVTDQRSEVAALRLSREAQLDTLRTLQHLVRKRTLELDHAEVANIRAVEKKAEDVVRKEAEALQQQSAAMKKAQLRQKSRSGADAPPQPLRPTRSTMKQLEETHRRLQHLKHVSPTAALGSRFSYNEFGHPEFAIDSLERVHHDVMALHESPIAARTSREMGAQATELGAEATRRSLSFERATAVAEVRAPRPSASLSRDRRQPSHYSTLQAERKHSGQSRGGGSQLALPASQRDGGRSSYLGVELSSNSHASPNYEVHPYAVTGRAEDVTVEQNTAAAAAQRKLSSSTNSRGTPPLSPKQQRRVEPDHAVTVLSSRTGTSWDMSAVAGASSLLEFPPTDMSPPSDLHSQRVGTPREGSDEMHQSTTSTQSASTPLTKFRFPQQPSRVSPSSSVLLAPEAGSPPGALPPSEDYVSHKRASLRLQQQRANVLSEQIEGRVLAAQRRRTSTGHGTDGSLSHPLTGLVGLAGDESQSSPHLESPEHSTSVMRWTVGTSAQQMHLSSIYGDTTGGTSITTMSPTKRISESEVAPRAAGERRKPSDAILDEASRLVGSTLDESSVAEATVAPGAHAAAAVSRRGRDTATVKESWTADSMSAVPRGVHTARSKSHVHPYHFTGTGVAAIEFSLDESISKAKPNFRSHSNSH